MDPEHVRAQASPEALELGELLERFAAEHRIARRDTPSGMQLRASDDSTVAQTYMQHATLDIDLGRVRDRGSSDLADEALRKLRSWTGKTLTDTYPAFPAADALTHWEERELLLLQLCQVSRSTDSTAP